jgi:hypothetical protein
MTNIKQALFNQCPIWINVNPTFDTDPQFGELLSIIDWNVERWSIDFKAKEARYLEHNILRFLATKIEINQDSKRNWYEPTVQFNESQYITKLDLNKCDKSA